LAHHFFVCTAKPRPTSPPFCFGGLRPSAAVIMDGMVMKITPEQEVLIQKKNLLVNALGSEGQQIVVVGDTSTGKSTTINFLLGYPINFEARGIGTRRPCVISQEADPNSDVVTYSIKFNKAKEAINEVTTDMERVRTCVTHANDPVAKPHYFDQLEEDPSTDLNGVFDFMPIFVTMRHKDFKYGLRLIDLPGLVRKYEGPMEIAKKYIKPGNIVILVMGKGNPANGGFPDLAERMVESEEVLFVQNFATDVLGSGDAELNFETIKKKYMAMAAGGNKRAGEIASGLQFYMLDVGYPKSQEFMDRGQWKEGRDQANWGELAERGCEVVQKAMYDHAEARATLLRQQFAADFAKYGFGAGVSDILNKIVAFSFSSIEQKIVEYRKRCMEMIEEQEGKYAALSDKCKTLDNPREWQAVLSKAAATVSEFLDTTIAIPVEDPDGSLRDVVTCLKTVDQEINLPDDWEPEHEKEFGRHRKCWFTDDIDKKIYDIICENAGFEKDKELACLRSWYRVLDELIAFLAFAPMPYVELHEKVQRMSRIEMDAASDSTNKLHAMVELVAALDGKDGKYTGIRSLILQFTRRVIRLAQRDLRNGLTMFRQDKHNAIGEFLDLVGDNTVESKTELCNKIEEIILEHMRKTFQETITGTWEYTQDGKIAENVFGQPIKKAMSGLCVRRDPNVAQDEEAGPPWWLLPFKGHYFNGQIPWKDLRLGPDFVDGPPTALKSGAPSLDDPLLSSEIDDAMSLNASNYINLKIFQLCTTMYDIETSIKAPELDYSLEVMKLLKAMQGEVASFWSSSKIRVLQDIKNKDLIKDFFDKALKADLKAEGLVIELQNFEDWSKSLLGSNQAVEATIDGFSEIVSQRDFFKTTKQEIEEAAAELQRKDRNLYKSLPTEELAWPGLSTNDYAKVISSAQSTRASARDRFPTNAGTPLVGDAAFRRLADEFAFVILQLSMKPVSASELAMAKASRGQQIVESPQEIITKLVCHRLQSIGQNAGIIFKYRFLWLYSRMADKGLSMFLDKKSRGATGGGGLPNIGALKGADWIKKKFGEYCEKVVDDLRGKLAKKFDELTPFDWTTLNGRFPFGGQRPVCPSMHYRVKPGATPTQLSYEKVEPALAAKEIHAFYDQALRYQWPDLNEPEPQFFLVKDAEQDNRMSLDEKTNQEAFRTLDGSRCEDEITQAMLAGDADPPAGKDDLAGGVFHEMALRVHKSMVASAIDFCKPKLKNMMSQVYREENLREALVRSPKLKFKDKYGDLVRKMKKELGDTDARRKELQETIDILDGKAKEQKKEADLGALAAAAEKKAKLEQAENAALAAKIEELEKTGAAAGSSIEELTTQNDSFKSDLKKYIANEMLSCWSLALNDIELSRLPSPGEEAEIILQGFYFRAPGWNGRDPKKVTPPKTADVFPYQWLFCCDPKPFEDGKSLTWKVDDFYGNNATGLSGLSVPALYPVQEYLLAIEVKAIIGAKKKGFFGAAPDAKEKTLFSIILPLAYALSDKTDEFRKLESVGAFGPLHRAPTFGGAFRMEDRGSRGGPEKTYKFIYEEEMKHYGMEVPEARGAKLEILLSQTQLRQMTARSTDTGSFKPPSRAGMKPGDQALYYSSGRKAWFPCKIVKAHSDGTYEIDLKPGEKIDTRHVKPRE